MLSFRHFGLFLFFILGDDSSQLKAHYLVQAVIKQPEVVLVQLVQTLDDRQWNVAEILSQPLARPGRLVDDRERHVLHPSQMQRQLRIIHQRFVLADDVVLQQTRMAQLRSRFPVLIERQVRVPAQLRRQQVLDKLQKRNVMSVLERRVRSVRSERFDDDLSHPGLEVLGALGVSLQFVSKRGQKSLERVSHQDEAVVVGQDGLALVGGERAERWEHAIGVGQVCRDLERIGSVPLVRHDHKDALPVGAGDLETLKTS